MSIGLSPQLAAVVQQTLRELSPIVDEGLASLELIAGHVSGRRGIRMREERDAVALALEISQLRVPSAATSFARRSPQDAVAFAQTMGAVVAEDNEDDLIAEDLRRFDPHGTLVLHGAAMARFVDGDFALRIFNVNRKSLEHVLGVDLLYLDETRNVFTLVQYKRLTRRTTAQDNESLADWTYKRKSDLIDQLALMDVGRHRAVRADDWRLSRSPFWFKFAPTDAFQSADPLVLRGMYVSAEYLRLAIADGSLQSGPNAT